MFKFVFTKGYLQLKFIHHHKFIKMTVLEVNSVLKLKNEILEIIVSLQTEEALSKILESAKIAVEEEDLWSMVTPEQMERIEKIIEKTDLQGNRMTHEEAKKKHAKWLS
jgi:hypothetical protein